MEDKISLKRTLSLTLLSFYGLGTILGAGIYALIGTVAKDARDFTAYSFLLASFIALFTAASYAELSSRFPQSAGSALYIRKGFQNSIFSGIIGWLVVITGVVSAGTLAHGFANYLASLIAIPNWLSVLLVINLLGLLALWGIRESATTIMWMTLIEVLGLAIVIIVGGKAVFVSDISFANLVPPSWVSINGIVIGAFVAFYAFIGFEDMVNTAEETLNPETTVPYAIFIALLCATLLYLLVAIVVVKNLTYAELSGPLPLTKILERHNISPVVFILIAMISIMNGIIVQIIMSSRLIYGMANQNNAPRIFHRVSPKRQTPIYATLLVMLLMSILALIFPIETLAKMTSTIMLCIFVIVHLALIKIKIYSSEKAVINVPIIVPVIGALLTTTFLFCQFLISL